MTLTGPADSIASVRFSPDSEVIIGAGFDRTAIVWRLTRPTSPIHILQGHTATVYDALITPKGDYAITAGSDRHIKVWRLSDGAEVLSLNAHARRSTR